MCLFHRHEVGGTTMLISNGIRYDQVMQSCRAMTALPGKR
jgi:hypothetical protein